MTLELLYLAGCPNRFATVDLVRSALESEGMSAEVRQILISNLEEAIAHGFPGSPTVRVNGIDIEQLAAHGLGAGMACRTYFVEGKLQGLPPRFLVVRAIRAAREKEHSP